jgi:hypothetical protein
MADEETVVADVVVAQKPNMDEQSAAPPEKVEVEIPPAEAVEKKEPEKKDEVVAEAKVDDEAAKSEQAEPEDWRAKELRRKHAQIKERDRQLADQAAKIKDLEELATRAAPAEGEKVAPVVRPDMSQAQIQAAARALRDQERYAEDLTNINNAGEKNYGKEWGKSLENLASFGEVEMPTMQGILATDDPAKVLYELGRNPAEYQRIMDLPAARRQTEFVKMSLKQAPKKTVSSAPEPVETVRGRVTPSALPQDSDDDDTWYKKWNEHQQAKRKKA